MKTIKSKSVSSEKSHVRETSLIEVNYFNRAGELRHSDLNSNEWLENNGKWSNHDLNLAFEIKINESSAGCSFSIPINSLEENGDNRISSFVIAPEFLSGTEGDDAEFVLPCDLGVTCRLSGKSEGEYIIPGFSPPNWPSYVMNMLVAAKITENGSRLMIIDDCRFDSGFRLRTNFGEEHLYQVDAMFYMRRRYSDRLPEDSPTILCREIPGPLSAVSEFYRNYIIKRLNITPLKDKFAKSKALKEAAESVLIRLRMAVKPTKIPVEEQTLENQPDVEVFMDFDTAVKLAEECARQNVESIDFTLVGWNYGGHDGAFPQILPVEEKLGGKKAMLDAVKRIKELGYKVGIHDNFIDSYTLANNLNRSDWALSGDGKTIEGGVWGGGRAHLLCPQRALEQYLPEHFADLNPFDLNGSYYVDVISLTNLYTCSAPDHPLSLKESAGYWKKILLKQREFSEVAMSEGAREWALPELDRAYAAANRPDPHTELPFADKTVPLFPMIFHGLLIYNSCRMTVNAMPGERFYLDNIAFGGLALLFFYQRFQANASVLNTGCDDLTISSDEKLREDVSRIKRIADDIKRIAPLQDVFINDYQTLDNGLTCVSYENGAKMYVNYSNETNNTPEGITVPERDFIITS